jgi:hypothetical protein
MPRSGKSSAIPSDPVSVELAMVARVDAACLESSTLFCTTSWFTSKSSLHEVFSRSRILTFATASNELGLGQFSLFTSLFLEARDLGFGLVHHRLHLALNPCLDAGDLRLHLVLNLCLDSGELDATGAASCVFNARGQSREACVPHTNCVATQDAASSFNLLWRPPPRDAMGAEEVPPLFAMAVRYRVGDDVKTPFGPGRVRSCSDRQTHVEVALQGGAVLYARVRGLSIGVLGMWSLTGSLSLSL